MNNIKYTIPLSRTQLIDYLKENKFWNTYSNKDGKKAELIAIHVDDFYGPEFLASLGSIKIFSNPEKEITNQTIKAKEKIVCDATTSLVLKQSDTAKYLGHLPLSEIIQSVNGQLDGACFFKSDGSYLLWKLAPQKSHTLHMANDKVLITDPSILARAIQCHFSDLDWEK